MSKEPNLYRTRVFIIGPSATGKSTCGALAARNLKLPFVDTDCFVSDYVDNEVFRIFAEQGATYFRKINEKIIEHVCTESDFGQAIIAVGATSNLAYRNRLLLKNTGRIIIKLSATPHTILQRIIGSTQLGQGHAAHPLLIPANPLQYISLLLEFREPYYNSIADVIIETDSKSRDDVAIEIINIVKNK